MFLLGFINNLFQGADGIIILLIVLLLFGAKKLPELARGLGSAISEFNKAKDDVQRQIIQTPEPIAPPVAAPEAPVATLPQPATPTLSTAEPKHTVEENHPKI